MAAIAILPARGANLLDIYHLAQNNDPTFRAARYTLAAAQEKIPQARAGLLPNLSMNGGKNRTRATSTFTDTPTVRRSVDAWTWTLKLTQPLFRMQKVFAYKESKFQVRQARAQFAQAEQALILRVAQAYFGVVTAQETISAAKAQLQATRAQFAQAKRGFRDGTHAITDMYEAQSRMALAHSQLVSARDALEIKRAALEKIVGPISAPLDRLRPAIAVPQPQPDVPRPWIAQSQENNPAVQAQRAALAAAEAEVSKNRAAHLPTLDWSVSYGKNNTSGNIANPTDYATRSKSIQTGVQLNIPIYAGGAINARIAEAMANEYKAQAELEAARRQAGADARQAYAGIENGLSKIKALDSAVTSSKSAVKGNRIGFKLGIRMNINVLNAEKQLYTARRDLAKARYGALFQGLKLKAAAGILAASDLQALDSLLGPPLGRTMKHAAR
ncbi:MAG TPA: type I secretion protein TolC [Betaproteobacteria bacterium]|nr:type I secretion protein TolC [Betaproteobacteria bacterium]